MELRTLRYFVAIAKTGNMRKAAEQVRVAQPALSRQMRMLEEELGVVLFERMPRGIKLSAAGSSFLEDATDVLWAAENARQRAGLLASGAIGSIRLALHGPAHRCTSVQTILRMFNECYPNVRLAIRHLTSERQVQALLDDQIDVGFAYHPGAPVAQVYIQEIDHDHTVLAMRDDHPLATQPQIDLSLLRDEPFIGGDPTINHRTWTSLFNACARAGFTPRLAVEGATSEHVIASMISAGLGIGFLPAAAKARSPSNLAFKKVAGLSADYTVVCLSRRKRGSPVAERFVSVVDDYLQSKP